MTASLTYLQEVLSDDPVWALSCNELTGTVVADATPNALHGGLVGSYSLGQAPLNSVTGKSIAFSGGRIAIPYDAKMEITNDYTFGCINLFTGTELGMLFGFFNGTDPYSGIAIYGNHVTPGRIGFRETLLDANTVVTPTPDTYNDGIFRVLHFIRRASVMEIWVNGVLVVTKTVALVNESSNPSQYLMGNSFGQGLYGRLDEAAFYTKALAPDRIAVHVARAFARLRLAGSATLDSGLKAAAVLIRDWSTNQHLYKVVPATDGTWQQFVDPGSYEVTVVGPAGYQPICHGPVGSEDF